MTDRACVAVAVLGLLLAYTAPAFAAEAPNAPWSSLIEGGGLLAFAAAVYHLLHKHLGELAADRRAAEEQRKFDAAQHRDAVARFADAASANGSMLAVLVDRVTRDDSHE